MHPWGLSGPEFLWLYAAGLAVGLAVAFGVRIAVRRPRLTEQPGRLAPEELGFLAGGPQHAVQVAVARLVDADLVRVDRSGTLTSVADGAPAGHPLDNAVLAALTAPRKVAEVAERLAGSPAVTGIGESLVRNGLLVAPSRATTARRLAPLLLYVLFAIGMARWVNGLAEDLPVGYLTFLLAGTLVASVYLSSRLTGASKARTVHGDRVMAKARGRRRIKNPLERVAVRGLSAYPDKELSRALSNGAMAGVVGGAWSYSSAGSFDSFAHSGPSGGGSYTHNYTSGDSSSSGSSCGGGSGGGCGGGSP
jgi:uncharacterized protein (TIGR04222 family)